MSIIPPAEKERIKAEVDMFTLASQYTELRKGGRRGEMWGPCPIPGCASKDNGFVVFLEKNRFYCRKCEQRGDVIKLVQLVKGVSFREACERLTGHSFTPAKPIKRPAPEPKPEGWTTEAWQRRAVQRVDEEDGQRLDSDAGRPGRAYLEQRGITQQTAAVWALGFVERTPLWKEGPAIAMPYLDTFDTYQVWAIRYRHIAPVSERFCYEPGSNGRKLYGLHQVDQTALTIVLVEGEFNAMSIWQDARTLGLTAVSLGSQNMGEEKLQDITDLTRYFHQCLVWCDEATVARKVYAAATSPVKQAMKSPPGEDGKKLDANDLLRRGQLRELMEDRLTKFVIQRTFRAAQQGEGASL